MSDLSLSEVILNLELYTIICDVFVKDDTMIMQNTNSYKSGKALNGMHKRVKAKNCSLYSGMLQVYFEEKEASLNELHK